MKCPLCGKGNLESVGSGLGERAQCNSCSVVFSSFDGLREKLENPKAIMKLRERIDDAEIVIRDFNFACDQGLDFKLKEARESSRSYMINYTFNGVG